MYKPRGLGGGRDEMPPRPFAVPSRPNPRSRVRRSGTGWPHMAGLTLPNKDVGGVVGRPSNPSSTTHLEPRLDQLVGSVNWVLRRAGFDRNNFGVPMA